MTLLSPDLIAERLATLSLEQKVRLLTGSTFWRTFSEPAIGLKEIVMSDGPVGVRGESWDERNTSATIPSPTSLAATWDEPLVEQLGALLAAEARRKGVDVLLAPTINLHRSPLGGRHFESYSEDPLLTARIGRAYVRGVQGGGVGATAKHYVANDAETDRFTVDTIVDERTLRELYLAPFEALVDEGAWLVMSGYNGVNGATMSENDLLRSPLKDEWGFDGLVVSDWTAVRSTEASARAAQDLAMPGPNPLWGDALLDAVRAGRVPEQAIDDKVRRLLVLAARVGRLADVDPAVADPSTPSEPDRALLRRASAAGMVLVRNEVDAVEPLLPLTASALRTVAVLGPGAATARIQGGGSAGVYPADVVSPVDGIRAALGDDVLVTTTVGTFTSDDPEPLTTALVTAPMTGEPGLLVRLLSEDGTVLRSEERRSGKLLWSGDDQVAVAAAEIEVSAHLHADTAGRWTIAVGGVGRYTLEVDGEIQLNATLEAPGGDPAAVLFAPQYETVELDLADGQAVSLVARHRPDMSSPFRGVWLAVRRPRRTAEDELDEAVALAAEADVAIVVVGTTDDVESEGFDRNTLALPGRQDALVTAVAAANARTVVVVNSGAPVALPWREQVAALLFVWFPGQEFGTALADVLLGEVEPGGRLPTTWAADEADVPVLSTTPVDGRLVYSEGLHIGYRAWARHSVAPAYPFGTGLGYTTWRLDSLDAADPLTPGVRLTNTGARRGRQVVQAYLSRPDSAVDRPALWLAGFAAVELDGDGSAVVDIAIEPRAYQHWDVDAHAWATEPGEFTLAVGFACDDLPLSATVTPPG